MHTVVRVVIVADGPNEATTHAENYFDGEIVTASMFDYCKLMDTSHDRFGANRFTEYKDKPLAIGADSKTGRQEIEDTWEETKQSFRRHLAKFTEGLAQHDSLEDIMGDYILRGHAQWMKSGKSTDTYLYAPHISGAIDDFRRYTELKASLDGRTWVVPLDAYY